MFNQKGQAFSVFQLLIAAVVALAILGLLMSIIGGLSFTASKEPDQVSKDLLRSAINGQFTGKVEDATFTSKKNEINTDSLAQVTQTGAQDIAVCVDDELSGQFTHDNRSILYTGSSDLTVRIIGYCGQRDSDKADKLKIYTVGGSKALTCEYANSEALCAVAVTRAK